MGEESKVYDYKLSGYILNIFYKNNEVCELDSAIVEDGRLSLVGRNFFYNLRDVSLEYTNLANSQWNAFDLINNQVDKLIFNQDGTAQSKYSNIRGSNKLSWKLISKALFLNESHSQTG